MKASETKIGKWYRAVKCIAGCYGFNGQIGERISKTRKRRVHGFRPVELHGEIILLKKEDGEIWGVGAEGFIEVDPPASIKEEKGINVKTIIEKLFNS